MLGLLGKKIGMTQIFDEEGRLIPITVIEAGPCSILEVKERSVLVGFEDIKEGKLNKAQAGYFKKKGLKPKRQLREISKQRPNDYKVGEEYKVDIFKKGEFLDITSISIGKGFQGGMKRWGWHGGPKTHGSTSHRRAGSIGATTDPGRVWRGHHMPGHMGARRVTVQNSEIVKIEPEHNLLVVKGSIPGHRNCYLLIRKAKKK